MYKLVDALIKEMGTAYPELSRARAVITNTLKTEEEKFRETLEKGLKILEENYCLRNSFLGDMPRPRLADFPPQFIFLFFLIVAPCGAVFVLKSSLI